MRGFSLALREGGVLVLCLLIGLGGPGGVDGGEVELTHNVTGRVGRNREGGAPRRWPRHWQGPRKRCGYFPAVVRYL